VSPRALRLELRWADGDGPITKHELRRLRFVVLGLLGFRLWRAARDAQAQAHPADLTRGIALASVLKRDAEWCIASAVERLMPGRNTLTAGMAISRYLLTFTVKEWLDSPARRALMAVSTAVQAMRGETQRTMLQPTTVEAVLQAGITRAELHWWLRVDQDRDRQEDDAVQAFCARVRAGKFDFAYDHVVRRHAR
jgi:hypothetical protein